MSTFWIASFASLATLLGGWGVVRFLQGRAQFMRLLSGVAAGYLLSVTVVRIIPECLEAKGGELNAYWVLAGYLLVHVMEHGITLHFHYGEETHTDGSPLSGVLALIGLSLHSLMDGVAIAAALSTHSNLGPLVVLGILFHRIPEGGTIASIFLVRGFGNRAAMLAAGTLALAAMLGAAGQSLLNLPTGPILGLTAGLALYVASSDLLPEVQKVSGLRSTIALLSGVGIFLLSSRLLPHQH
ncbi:MAG: ZIP family metal transporter [Geothrix sp.]|uniref:ZIP family metal transporter n=1 Tax=Geothrix sp. TaxID=1962974 RepID=UPI003BB0F2E3